MNDINTIHIGIGLGKLCFGSSMDECRAMLGEPEDVMEETFDDEVYITWFYHDGTLTLHFEESEDFRLGTIAVSHDGALLDGKAVMGKTIEEITGFLTATNRTFVIEQDIEDREMTLIEVQDMECHFIFINNRLETVQWSYFWIDGDTPNWPEH